MSLILLVRLKKKVTSLFAMTSNPLCKNNVIPQCHASWTSPKYKSTNVYKLTEKTDTRKQMPIYECSRKLILPINN